MLKIYTILKKINFNNIIHVKVEKGGEKNDKS